MTRVALILKPVLLLVICLLAASAEAADLRASVGDRSVMRTVGHRKYAPVVTSAVPDVVSEVPVKIQHGSIVTDGCSSCGIADCGGCYPSCCFLHGYYGRSEVLLWWRRGRRLPALITSAPANEIPSLDNPNTTVLVGNDTLGGENTPGGRVTLGAWLDPYGYRAIEGRYFALGRDTLQADLASDATMPGSTSLGRPLTLDGTPASRTLATTAAPPAPNNPGTAGILSRSEVMGGDVMLRQLIIEGPMSRFDILAGYQWTRFDEDLRISDSTVLGGMTPQSITDIFETNNQYNAGLIGVEWSHARAAWRFELLAKVGFGNMRQEASVSAVTVNSMSGFLANPGNIGNYSRNVFSVSPELGANVVYQLRDWLDVQFGYSFIHWSNVLQPGDQVITDFMTVGGVPITSFPFNDRSYYVHGFNCGIEGRF